MPLLRRNSKLPKPRRSPRRLGVAEKNTEALKAAPLSRTQTELRPFLELCDVYRRFVSHFSAIAAPLNALLFKGMPPDLGHLSPAAISAFQAFRDRLISPPVFALPRAVGHLWLDTDASDGQLGCCVLQRQPDGQTLLLGIGPALYQRPNATTRPPRRIVWPLSGQSHTYDPTSSGRSSPFEEITTP
jgi:hypothetical protein